MHIPCYNNLYKSAWRISQCYNPCKSRGEWEEHLNNSGPGVRLLHLVTETITSSISVASSCRACCKVLLPRFHRYCYLQIINSILGEDDWWTADFTVRWIVDDLQWWQRRLFWRCGHQHREGEKTERLKKVWQHEDKKRLSLETGITEFHSYKHYIYSHPLINITWTDKQTSTQAPSPSLSLTWHIPCLTKYTSLPDKIYLRILNIDTAHFSRFICVVSYKQTLVHGGVTSLHSGVRQVLAARQHRSGVVYRVGLIPVYAQVRYTTNDWYEHQDYFETKFWQD